MSFPSFVFSLFPVRVRLAFSIVASVLPVMELYMKEPAIDLPCLDPRFRESAPLMALMALSFAEVTFSAPAATDALPAALPTVAFAVSPMRFTDTLAAAAKPPLALSALSCMLLSCSATFEIAESAEEEISASSPAI